MARKIKLYSKLPKIEQKYINSLIDGSELKIINVNYSANTINKGVLINSEEDELLVIFDSAYKQTKMNKDVDEKENEKEYEIEDENVDENDNEDNEVAFVEL